MHVPKVCRHCKEQRHTCDIKCYSAGKNNYRIHTATCTCNLLERMVEVLGADRCVCACWKAARISVVFLIKWPGSVFVHARAFGALHVLFGSVFSVASCSRLAFLKINNA